MSEGLSAMASELDLPAPHGLPAPLRALLSEAAQLLERDLDAARLLLDRAMALLDPPGRANSPAAGALAAWQARRVAEHIEQRLDAPLRLDDLAAVVGLSSSYFSRAFKASFGEAPHAFVLRRRVTRAQTRMLASTEPLARIAIDCGFADQAHLSRSFRRLVGAAPHAWRRAHASGPAAPLSDPR